MDSDGSSWRGRLIRYTPVVLIIGTILLFSSSGASFQNTSRFLGPFLVWLLPEADIETLRSIHVFLRKLGHLSGYGILGFVAANAFRNSHFTQLRKRTVFSAVLLVLVVAIIDETNQSFVPQRTGSALDVIIDIAGGLIGALFLNLWLFVYHKVRGTSARN